MIEIPEEKHELAVGCACFDCMNERLSRFMNAYDPYPATMADFDQAVFESILDATKAYVENGDVGCRWVVVRMLERARQKAIA